MGTMMMASNSRKFVRGVGFSNGCALFTLYQPPPLVKSCLMDSSEATGPTGIAWAFTGAFTITGWLVMMAAPLASSCGTSTITGWPLVSTGWPFASSLGWDTVTAMLVVRLLPLVSVACTWVV